MGSCKMVKLVAQLTPQYDLSGKMTAIVNTSKWQDGRKATSAKRQTRWVVTKNGRIVVDFGFHANPLPVPVSGLSSGESLVLPLGAKTIMDYLDAQNVVIGRMDTVQIRIQIINADKIKSGWSNPITLPHKGGCVRAIKSFSLKNLVTFSGQCLVPYSATV